MNVKSLLQGIGLGAGLMYYLDPERGRRRRALVIDQWDHAVHWTQDFFGKAQRDLRNRARGTAAEASSLLRRDRADDRVVVERVRARLGRYVSHPHAILVDCHQGRVTLRGPILADEVQDLLQAVRRVRGVMQLENHLDIHHHRGDISALQGGTTPPGEHYDFQHQNWNPATRAAAQIAGLFLMGNCLARRNVTSMMLGTVGFGLFLRGMTNRSFQQMVGLPGAPHASRFQRTVVIHASIDRVWDLINDFEQLGQYLPGVEALEHLGGDRYRWTLHLPGGQHLAMEEQVTERVPMERLSWISTSNQPVSYCGCVVVQRESDDATRVNVHLEYTPPGGALGEALASLFGMDAQSIFNQAVMRVKTFLETGNPPHDLHAVRRMSSESQR